MFRMYVGLVCLAVCLMLPGLAWADVYNFQYYSGASYSTSDAVYASGTLTVTQDGINEYLITGVGGARNGDAITGLINPYSIDGTSVDDLIFFAPPPPTSIATFTLIPGSDPLWASGFAFATVAGVFQPYTWEGGAYGSYGPYSAGQYEYTVGTYSSGPMVNQAITFDVSAVPEPTSILFMGTVLLGLAGALKRKWA